MVPPRLTAKVHSVTLPVSPPDNGGRNPGLPTILSAKQLTGETYPEVEPCPQAGLPVHNPASLDATKTRFTRSSLYHDILMDQEILVNQIRF